MKLVITHLMENYKITKKQSNNCNYYYYTMPNNIKNIYIVLYF